MERTVSAGSPRSTGPSPMAGAGRYHGSRGPQAGAQAPEPEEPWQAVGQAGRCTTTRQPNTLQANWCKAEMHLLKLGGEEEEEGGNKLEEKEVRWEKQESRVGCSGLARAS